MLVWPETHRGADVRSQANKKKPREIHKLIKNLSRLKHKKDSWLVLLAELYVVIVDSSAAFWGQKGKYVQCLFWGNFQEKPKMLA